MWGKQELLRGSLRAREKGSMWLMRLALAKLELWGYWLAGAKWALAPLAGPIHPVTESSNR